MSDLQRKAFEYLKKNIHYPSSFYNFTIHTNTCDKREVSMHDRKLGFIRYEKECRKFWSWAKWACTVSIDGIEVTDTIADESVIKDIIEYEKHIKRKTKDDEAMEERLNKIKLMELLDKEMHND